MAFYQCWVFKTFRIVLCFYLSIEKINDAYFHWEFKTSLDVGLLGSVRVLKEMAQCKSSNTASITNQASQLCSQELESLMLETRSGATASWPTWFHAGDHSLDERVSPSVLAQIFASHKFFRAFWKEIVLLTWDDLGRLFTNYSQMVFWHKTLGSASERQI